MPASKLHSSQMCMKCDSDACLQYTSHNGNVVTRSPAENGKLMSTPRCQQRGGEMSVRQGNICFPTLLTIFCFWLCGHFESLA